MSSKNSSMRVTWRLLKPHAQPMIPLLVLTTVLGAVSAAAAASVILLIKPVFSVVLFPNLSAEELAKQAKSGLLGDDADKFNDWFLSAGHRLYELFGFDWLADSRMNTLVAVLGVLVVVTVVASLLQYAFNQTSNYVSLRLVVGVRVRVTRHLMGLGLHYHGQRKLGDLLSRISGDIQLTLVAVVIWFRDFLQNGFLGLFYLVFAATMAPLLTGVMILSIPVLAIPVSLLSKKVRKRSTKSLTSLGASVQSLTQMFLGIRTVKAFRAEETELERYGDLNEKYLKDAMRTVRAVSLTQAWTTFSTQIGLGALLLVVGIGGIYFDLFDDVGSLSGFFIANAQAYTHIKRFVRALTRMEESVGASVRLQELLDEEPDVVEAPGAVELDGFRDKLAFCDLSFEYPEGDGAALSHLNLEVQRGETLAIVGASGSGKSTLMALVCRFFDPTSGRIEVDGHDLRGVSLDSWTSLFSMVDQAPFLFHTSIAENLRYGKRDATDAELVEACKAAQIHDFIESLPEGYATNVADAGARLSGGQRQRITIARALLKGAPILLLDEATSALDTESERGVQEALETLMQGRTVIVIAHRLSTIQNADRICVLQGGKLVELGTHAELSEKGGAYARALELQQMG